jgi:hypothetical protein
MTEHPQLLEGVSTVQGHKRLVLHTSTLLLASGIKVMLGGKGRRSTGVPCNEAWMLAGCCLSEELQALAGEKRNSSAEAAELQTRVLVR